MGSANREGRVPRRLSPQVLLGVGISVALSAWFLHSVRWDELSEAMMQVRALPVALASGLLVLEFALRALRWKVLLRPVAPDARVGDLFTATVIGAAANTLLPARAGEIAKPLVACRKVDLPLPPVLATAVMERVYDIFGLVSVLVTVVVLMPDSIGQSGEDQELVRNLKLYGALFGAFALSCMAIFFALVTRGGPARRVFARIVSVAPRPVADRFLELYDGFVQGLGNTRDRSGLWQAAGLSLLIWFNGAVAIAVLFQAFAIDLPFAAACFTAVAIALTVALPQAPGFFGVFHVAIEKTALGLEEVAESLHEAMFFIAVFADALHEAQARDSVDIEQTLHQFDAEQEKTISALRQTLATLERSPKEAAKVAQAFAADLVAARLGQQPHARFSKAAQETLFSAPVTTADIQAWFHARPKVARSPQAIAARIASWRQLSARLLPDEKPMRAMLRHALRTEWWIRGTSTVHVAAILMTRVHLVTLLAAFDPRHDDNCSQEVAGEILVNAVQLVAKNMFHVPTFARLMELALEERGLLDLAQMLQLLPPTPLGVDASVG